VCFWIQFTNILLKILVSHVRERYYFVIFFYHNNLVSFLVSYINVLRSVLVRKTLLRKESSPETLTSSKQSLMTGCPWEWCSAGGRVVFMSALGKRTRKWLLWKCTEIIGAESTLLGKGASGACLLGTDGCFFEACVEWEGGVWFIIYQGHNGDQNGDPTGPKMEALLPAYFY
jgi:hypothetical protein